VCNITLFYDFCGIGSITDKLLFFFRKQNVLRLQFEAEQRHVTDLGGRGQVSTCVNTERDDVEVTSSLRHADDEDDDVGDDVALAAHTPPLL